jgi:hypothetical protein
MKTEQKRKRKKQNNQTNTTGERPSYNDKVLLKYTMQKSKRKTKA